jgi:beta-galactosidase GanA
MLKTRLVWMLDAPAFTFKVPVMHPPKNRLSLLSLILLLAGLGIATAPAHADNNPLPHLVTEGGRHALIVDGAPYLILGAQCHNSSAWPGMLPKVWPAIEYLHANTLEIPVYWEQFEPEPGKFDTSVIDTLLTEAREHNVRLVLLWFGTWKNGSSHYEPLWMKAQPEKYPRIIGKTGRRVDSPSPHAPATLQADIHAFSAFMRRLKSADAQHTVIMVQVENEPGSWGSVRDFSPDAQKLFAGQVPAELLQALGTNAAGGGNWSDVFGPNADEYFHAWSIARYIGQVAAAGKAEYPLPLYVNAALRDPLNPGSANTYESGGATDNVLDIWKAAAPAIDLLAPDIYQSDSARYRKVLELYGRPDNALFVPETRANGTASRWCFAALGRQAIGWSPFGLDYTAYSSDPFGLPRTTEEQLAPIALNFKMLEPIMREVARLNFEGKVQAVAEEKDEPVQTLDFGNWQAVVSYGGSPRGNSGAPRGNSEPIGRALIAKIGENQFWVTGAYCRIDFKAASGGQREFLRVEEVALPEPTHSSIPDSPTKPVADKEGSWHFLRIWNGDETDWGLNFSAAPQVVRVTLGTY